MREEDYWAHKWERESEILGVNLLTAIEQSSPHVLMHPDIHKEGDLWCAQLGDRIAGVCGLGISPFEACEAFDREWTQNLGNKKLEEK